MAKNSLKKNENPDGGDVSTACQVVTDSKLNVEHYAHSVERINK